MPTQSHSARRQCAENMVDAARVIEIATRYPDIELDGLAERFGVSGRTIYNILNAAGIRRGNNEPRPQIRAPLHPWRPAPRRSPQQIAISREERDRLVDDYLAKKTVTKIPRGVMTMSDVTFADTIHE